MDYVNYIGDKLRIINQLRAVIMCSGRSIDFLIVLTTLV
jgi:hypothetical protein